MTGSSKIEKSTDLRKYESHKDLLDLEDKSILQEKYNFITIRGYYNGTDRWVAEQTGPLYVPVDLARAVYKGIINQTKCLELLERVKADLAKINYDGSLLNADNLLLTTDSGGGIVRDGAGNELVVICNFELIGKTS